MVKKCSECGGNMEEKTGFTPEGLEYKYYKCKKCGEEVLGMKQLHAIAEKYRKLKIYHVKLTQWGQSLGLRIPKELVSKYHFKKNEAVAILPEKKGIRVIPE